MSETDGDAIHAYEITLRKYKERIAGTALPLNPVFSSILVNNAFQILFKLTP
jgi:hypothetical protein